jgi:hypothetical protein
MSILRRSVGFIAIFTPAILTACGGGGSSASAERLGLSRETITLTVPVNSAAHLEERIVAKVYNAGSPNYFIRFSHSRNGLSNVVRTLDFGNEIEVILQFRVPVDLPPGVYNDQIRFDTCADASCSRVFPNLTATATIQFTITGATGIDATLNPSALSLQAFVTDPIVPGVPELAIMTAGTSVQPYVEVSSTQNAVLHASGSMSDLNHGGIRLELRRPADLGPGVFDDTLEVAICLDAHCVNPIPQSPLILSLRVTVTDSVGGPNGYTVSVPDVAGTAMVWDELRQLIYLAKPDPTYLQIDQNIVVFDPASRASYAVPVVWRPGAMAISDDNSFLYVDARYTEDVLKRLRLPDLSEDLSVDLGVNANGQPYAASELAVAPSQPDTVAVARTIHIETAGLVVFDDATPRSGIVGAVPDAANGPVIDHIAWGADETRMFASNDFGQNPEIYEVSIDANGGQIVRTTNAATRGRLDFEDGLLYTGNGLIFNTTTMTEVAGLVAQQDGTDGIILGVLADASTNRIYAIAVFPYLPPIALHFPLSLVSFDLTQRTQIASIPLDPTLRFLGGDMLRFGSDGLALLAPGEQLVLVNGLFVAP